MYTVLIILVLIPLIISLIQYLSNRKWTLLYTAFGAENYFVIIGKLKTAGINYKSKTPINFRGNESRFLDKTQYDIYVKKEEEHLANQAMKRIN